MLRQAERDLEKYGMDKDYGEVVIQEIGDGINKLRDNPMFASMPKSDQEAQIKGVYDSLGVTPPPSIGVPDLDVNVKPPKKGAGLAAIEAAQTARAEQEKGERTATSEAEEILGYKTGRGLFGSADQELYDVGYAGASPEVKAEIDRLTKDRADREAARSEAMRRYGQLGNRF
jgi:hypothetical protein